MDSAGRIVASRLSEVWAQQVVIENKPGAGGTIALDAAAHAAPDGYTLLITAGSPATYGFLFSLGFDPVADLAPLSVVGRFPNMMVVPNSSPWKSLDEFIAYAKANPGKINWASPGVGTSPHLAGELFKRVAGIEMTHVPYRGAGPALTDLLAGQVQVSFPTMPASIEHIRTGKLRALAVTTAKRSEALPGIPTVGEFLPGYEASAWYGIGAPRNAPAEIVDKLNREINAALADPKLKARLADVGGDVLALSPVDFGKLIADETEKWGKVIRAANIKPE
jgi:tripartite-type tricarboxylate transporter receptor subunit TctC